MLLQPEASSARLCKPHASNGPLTLHARAALTRGSRSSGENRPLGFALLVSSTKTTIPPLCPCHYGIGHMLRWLASRVPHPSLPRVACWEPRATVSPLAPNRRQTRHLSCSPLPLFTQYHVRGLYTMHPAQRPYLNGPMDRHKHDPALTAAIRPFPRPQPIEPAALFQTSTINLPPVFSCTTYAVARSRQRPQPQP